MRQECRCLHTIHQCNIPMLKYSAAKLLAGTRHERTRPNKVAYNVLNVAPNKSIAIKANTIRINDDT
jgi:hypothetical protein